MSIPPNGVQDSGGPGIFILVPGGGPQPARHIFLLERSGELEHGLGADRPCDAPRVVRERPLLGLREPPERLDEKLDAPAPLRAPPHTGNATVDEQRRLTPFARRAHVE